MAEIVILCPIPPEYQAVKRLLVEPKESFDSKNKLQYTLGKIYKDSHNWNIALIHADENFHSIETTTDKAIQIFQPEYIFLVGVAGGVKDVAIGDIIVATKAYGYEYGKETPNGFVMRPEALRHTLELSILAKDVASIFKKEPYDIVFGPIASGNKVIACTDSQTFERIKKHLNDTTAIEKEAIGFARVASQLNCKYLNIRGISDLLDGKTESDKQGGQEIAAARAAAFTYQLISKLPFNKEGVISREIEIWFLQKSYRNFQLRVPRKGQLTINEDSFELIANKKGYSISNIAEVSHEKLPGELKKSWVKVRYLDQTDEKTLYISTVKLPGVGYVKGGSITLFNQISTLLQKKKVLENARNSDALTINVAGSSQSSQ